MGISHLMHSLAKWGARLLPHNLKTGCCMMPATGSLHSTTSIFFSSRCPCHSTCSVSWMKPICLSLWALHQHLIWEIHWNQGVTRASVDFSYTSSGTRQQHPMKAGWASTDENSCQKFVMLMSTASVTSLIWKRLEDYRGALEGRLLILVFVRLGTISGLVL